VFFALLMMAAAVAVGQIFDRDRGDGHHVSLGLSAFQ